MFYAVKNEMESFQKRHGYQNISKEEFKESYNRVSTCFFNWLHDPDVIPSELFECELDASIFDDMHQDYLDLW